MALVCAFVDSLLILGILCCFALSTLVTMVMNSLFCGRGCR